MVVFLCAGIVEASEQKHSLVAGGAGFLGSHLCERLLQEGYSVICLDNLQTGHLENIAPLMKDPHFTFVQHDVTQYYDPERHLDEIYNLACPASPEHYQQDPVKTLMSCVVGSYHLLKLAQKYDAKIFQASTSEVYGDPLTTPQHEKDWGHVNPIGLRSCYDEGKRAAEALFFDFHRQYRVKIKVARIFNTYGPRMNINDGRVVSNFIVQAITGKPLTIFGKGEQTRSFCYVTDLMEGIQALMATDETITGPINLGNPEEMTILEFARLILRKTGSKSPMVLKPLPQDDPKVRRPDISLAKRLLHWEPKVSTEEGLDYTISYFRQVLKR